MEFGMAGVAAITAIAYMVGLGVKASPLASKWIPLICAAVGGVLGAVGLYIMPGFPAGDVITAFAVGVVSGLAATGADQAFKQMNRREEEGDG